MPPRVVFRSLMFAALGLMLTVNALASPPFGEVSTKLNDYMLAAVKVDDFQGAVMVIAEDQVLYEGCFGLANREHHIPITPETKFRIGSVTKPFTAMAILLLQERNALSVQDRIGKHLGDVPEAWSEITVHHLLTHTSGIPNYTDFPKMMHETVRMPATLDSVIATFRDKPLDFDPGEKFNYSNSGYIVLGKLIEVVSGRQYDVFLREELLEPLGMNDTGHDWHHTILPHRAAGYDRKGDGFVNSPYIDMAWPSAAGAMYTTLRDMARWDRGLREQKLLSQNSYQAMYTPFKDGYAYGWAIDKVGDRNVITHSGGIHGFQAMISRYIDDELTVVVMSNVVPSRMGSVANALIKIALGEDVELPKPKVIATIDPVSFDALAGQYRLAPGVTLAFRREGERFFTQLTGQPELEIFPTSETEYFLKVVPARLTFEKGPDGIATDVTLHQGGRAQKAERIERHE